jgi:hypothetical protein
MHRLEVSCVVRPICGSLGAKGLIIFTLILLINFNKAFYRHRKRDEKSTPSCSVVKYLFGVNFYLTCESESFHKNYFFGLNSEPTEICFLITIIYLGQK